MKVENLRTLIRESINEYIREIEQAANEAAVDASITKCEEAIQLRQERLNKINENDDLKEMVDETKMKNIQTEIKILEKAKKKYAAQKAKMQAKKDKKANPEKEVTTDAPIDKADVTAEMNMPDDKQEEALNESFLKMQKLAGVITETQYNQRKKLIENQENEEFDVSQAYDKSPAIQSYDDMLDVVSGFEDLDFDAVESFENSFTEGKEITKDAWEKWYRTNIDGGYDPDNYLEISWISVTDPDIYDKAGV